MDLPRQSDRVREIVLNQYIRPVLESGNTRFSIRAGDVLKQAEASEGFPRGRTPTICAVLQSQKLLRAAGVEIERVDGPPSRQSRTLVVHYRVASAGVGLSTRIGGSMLDGKMVEETPAQKAHRLTEKMRGLLKDEIAAYGGAEAFIRWVRSDHDEEAA